MCVKVFFFHYFVHMCYARFLTCYGHRPIYFRFIDDIFIASLVPINLKEFKMYFLYLKLNIEYNDIVHW